MKRSFRSLLLALPLVVACSTSQDAAPNDGGADSIFTPLQWGGAVDDEVLALVAHPQGGVVLTGYENGDNSVINEGPVGDSRGFVIRLDRTGAQTWRRDLDLVGTTEMGERLVRASDGHLFVAGTTTGAFPGATNQGSFDLFVSELDDAGAPIATTQLGRDVAEHPAGIAVTTSGVFVAGQDEVRLAGSAVIDWQDAFSFALPRPLPASGTAPRWWLHEGSPSPDWSGGVAVEPDGSAVYVGGFVNAGANRGVYVRRLDANGALVWTKQISQISVDVITAVALSPQGRLYATGGTLGQIGPQQLGEEDVFVVELDRTTGQIVWSAQVGTAAADVAYALTFDAAGNPVVAGETLGSVDANVPYGGEGDAFALALDATTGAVLHAWQGASSGDDVARAIAIDSNGHAYVAGYTTGTLGPGATNAGRRDAFVLRAW